MTIFGVQKPRTKSIWWFTMTFSIGITLSSCKVEPDVVFVNSDAGDSGSDADGDSSNDSETAVLDSGSNISESGLIDKDGTIPVTEGGIDSLSLFLQFPLECPDENDVRPVDVCRVETQSESIYIKVDSEADCVPSYLEGYFEKFETTSDDSSQSSVCPQICKAIYETTIFNLPIILLFNLYYDDPKDPNTLVACPLTCEWRRCGDALISQVEHVMSQQVEQIRRIPQW